MALSGSGMLCWLHEVVLSPLLLHGANEPRKLKALVNRNTDTLERAAD
jgi:hypothetical protein